MQARVRQADDVDFDVDSCENVGMRTRTFAFADRALVVVTGKDRSSWLNGMVTCDVSKLTGGRALYGFLAEKKGRIQADFYLIASEGALALAVPRAQRDAVVATLDHHLIMEDAELATPELSCFYVSGPDAEARASELEGVAFRGTLDLLGEGGVVVLATGLPEGQRAEDPAAFEASRIERGLPRFGVEFDASFYPQEAGLEKLGVSFDKGCYLGQEVIYMLENRGHAKRKLVPLDLEGEGAVATGAPVATEAGDAVGDVRSSVVGPASGEPRAIALVKYGQAKPGTTLLVDGRRATVRAFP